MNWLDFIYLGPTSIWFLGVVILIHAIITHKSSHTTAQISYQLKQTRTELGNGVSTLGEDTSELRKDLSELKEEMGKTRLSIDNFYKTLRHIYSFWFPLGGSE